MSMRSKKFTLLMVSVLAVVLIAAMVFVACDPKDDNAASKYTVTFDIGEDATAGGATAPAAQQADQGQSVTLPSASWEGHVLLGWSDGEQQYEAGASYTPTKDITLKAVWGDNSITGSGTDEDPYVISTADALKAFADNVNHPEVEATKDWYKASFKLGADIDMTGVKYVPAGSRAVKMGSEATDTAEVIGFQGKFDGDGHTISNLSIEQNARSTEYIGLFGYTLQAYIHDLKLKNFSVRAISGADTADIKAYIGAVGGYLAITQIDCIEAELSVKMQWLGSNLATIGSIAGMYHSDASFIAYAENVKSKLTVDIEDFDSGSSISVLDKGYIGGMFGNVYVGYGSAVAIVNASSEANINGGKYLGGLIGYASGDNLSIINAYAKSTLKPSANVSGEERCYAGGIAGEALYDNIIMDSYADTVVETTVRETTAGGIVGSGFEDDFYMELTYGLGVVNSYYKLDAGNTEVDGTYGKETESAFNKEFATGTLKWNEQSWNFDGAVPCPTETRARDINGGKYTLTLKDGETETTKTYGEGDKGLDNIHTLDEAENTDNNVFWDWQFADDVDYRFYVPVVKDMTLTAKRVDVSGVLGLYEGNSKFSLGSKYVGIMELLPKGEVNYINSYSGTSTKGNFWYDGEHILIIVEDDSMCGTFSKTEDNMNEFAYVWQEGSYEVTYTFKQVEGVTLKGEYFSDNGDIITFTGSSNLSLILDGANSAQQLTFTTNDDGTLTINGLESKYSSATIENITSESFTANFVGIEGKAEDHKANYKKLADVDYSEQPFAGENYFPYINSGYSYTELRTITFNADGTYVLKSDYSEKPGKYYVFGTKVKLVLDSYISSFTLEGDMLVGELNTGATVKLAAVITKKADGEVRGYIIDDDVTDVVFVNNKGNYYVKGGKLQDAELDGKFADGEFVTIDGKKYVVKEGEYNSHNTYTLTTVGSEEGSYTYQSKTFSLDGVDKATGAIAGNYVINGKNIVVFNLETGEIFVFDYEAAKAANGNIAKEADSDGYRGIYFAPDNDDEESNPQYYALAFDGNGYCALYYYGYEEAYRYMWGDAWVTYTIQDNGDVSTRFNEYQKPVFTFCYDKQMVYANEKSDSSTIKAGMIYTVLGYDGPKEIPSEGGDEEFDPQGTWTGIINDNGYSLKGKTITVTFDAGTVEVKAGDYTFKASYTLSGKNITWGTNEDLGNYHLEDCTFTYKSNEIISFAFTITDGYDDFASFGAIDLTKQAEESEEKPFPQGTWTGKIEAITELNFGLADADITITFDANGKIEVKAGEFDFVGTYSYQSDKLTCNCPDKSNDYYLSKTDFKNLSDNSMLLEFTIDDGYAEELANFKVTLTKEGSGQAEAEEAKFPVGTWSGILENNMGHTTQNDGKPITFVFDANGDVKISFGSFNFTGKYSYSDNTLSFEIDPSGFSLTFMTITTDETTITLKFNVTDNDMFDYTYDATLKQA